MACAFGPRSMICAARKKNRPPKMQGSRRKSKKAGNRPRKTKPPSSGWLPPPACSSTCAAFGRGAAVAMRKEGERKEDILAGLHESIAQRVMALVRKVGIADKFVISGGIGRNVGLVNKIEEKLDELNRREELLSNLISGNDVTEAQLLKEADQVEALRSSLSKDRTMMPRNRSGYIHISHIHQRVLQAYQWNHSV